MIHNFNAVDRDVRGGVDRGAGFRTEANVIEVEVKVRYAWRWLVGAAGRPG